MKRLVVLASGSGSNFQRIVEACASEEIPEARVELLLVDRPCGATERAEKLGIPHRLIKRGKELRERLLHEIPTGTDLVVCAGFLSILPAEVCQAWKGKIINIHPSLLPKYGGLGMWGMHVHQAVKAAGETQSGATVHYVTSGVDEGEIILQQSVPLDPTDTPEDIAAKVHEIEYRIFPKAITQVLF